MGGTILQLPLASLPKEDPRDEDDQCAREYGKNNGAAQPLPASWRGRTGKGYPGMRRESPGPLLPGVHMEPPKTGLCLGFRGSREAQGSAQASPSRESLEGRGGPLPAACTALSHLGTLQGS